jgi:hypothetical protein
MQQGFFESEPYLTESDVERILTLAPKCPTCGEPPKYIYFHILAKHEMWVEVDGSPSEKLTDNQRLLVNIHSDPYDRTLRQPRGPDHPLIECENDHRWIADKYHVFDWGLILDE